MPIKGTVGWYREEPEGFGDDHLGKTLRPGENYLADQKTVTDLLNRIPDADGGQDGRLTAPTKDRTCYKNLADAIAVFQRSNFHKITGIVAPFSDVLSKMEELAYEATAKGGSNPLDMLQNSLSDFRAHSHLGPNRWTAGDMVAADRLAREAWEYIERIELERREKKLSALDEFAPLALVFGYAIIGKNIGNPYYGIPIGQRAPRQYGTPVFQEGRIETTEVDGPALILFKEGTGLFLPPNQHKDWDILRNRLEIGLRDQPSTQRVVVVSALDNP